MTLLKEIGASKWATLQEKVNNLGREVFEEVVETEMALAKFEEFSFGSSLPKVGMDSDKRSLLSRMCTIQASLKAKQMAGKMPKFHSTTDNNNSREENSESVQLSIMNEDSNELEDDDGDGIIEKHDSQPNSSRVSARSSTMKNRN